MIGLITLLVLAVVALRGYIPGGVEPAPRGPGRSALSVALMPVLLTVSSVILLAGVIASQHRLPLAMPEPEREDERQKWRLGRGGLLVLAALAGFALLSAVASAIFFVGVGVGGGSEPAPGAAPSTGTGAPPEASTTTPSDGAPSVRLTGTALVLAGVAAAGLVGVALAGVVVVAVATKRKPAPVPAPAAPAASSAMDSLARAAEMGLAAMNAPGQDPRTAIIACYVAMERGLASARSAAPLASDTPMEVLARAFERGALRDTSARELVALFEEARFSPHDMLAWQRIRAEQLLLVVLADLRAEVPA